MFTLLKVKDFLVFRDFSVEFSSGLNVFVGANGTGKTILMKLLYCIQTAGRVDAEFWRKLDRVFRPEQGKLTRLTRRVPGKSTATVAAETDAGKFSFTLPGKGEPTVHTRLKRRPPNAVYIPPKELLSLAPGLKSFYATYDTDIEEIYPDLIDRALLPALAGAPVKERADLLRLFREVIGGRVEESAEHFFIRSRAGRLEMPLVAEGHRKLALLARLVENGSLIEEGTLFWDEPEANLNPALTQVVVDALSRMVDLKVQVFLATHSYHLLKSLDLDLPSRIPKKTFVLSKTDNNINLSEAESYSDINPNPIAVEFERLLRLDLGIRT